MTINIEGLLDDLTQKAVLYLTQQIKDNPTITAAVAFTLTAIAAATFTLKMKRKSAPNEEILSPQTEEQQPAPPTDPAPKRDASCTTCGCFS